MEKRSMHAVFVALAVCLAAPAYSAEPQVLVPSGDPINDQDFGVGSTSVAYAGRNMVLVGSASAPFEGHAAQGVVYVFTRTGNEWQETARLSSAVPLEHEFFGVSLAVDGNTMVVGAPGSPSPDAEREGSAYVFQRIGQQWTQVARLTASDPQVGSEFGFNVAIDDGRIVVGAPRASTPFGFGAGAAYVFEYDPALAIWQQTEKLFLEESGLSGFASFVDIEGYTLTATLPNNRFRGRDGRVHVYERINDTWQQAAVLTAPPCECFPSFGVGTPRIDGERIAVGAFTEYHPGDAFEEGRVHVFGRIDGSWQHMAALAPEAPVDGTNFGIAINFDDGNLVIRPRLGGEIYLYRETAHAGWSREGTVQLAASQIGNVKASRHWISYTKRASFSDPGALFIYDIRQVMREQ